MNRPSRTDEPQPGDGYNQSPAQFSNDLTTNQDLNGISNTRTLLREERSTTADPGQTEPDPPVTVLGDDARGKASISVADAVVSASSAVSSAPEAIQVRPESNGQCGYPAPTDDRHGSDDGFFSACKSWLSKTKHTIMTFGKFVGPGFMVAVAYSMEISAVPGNI